MKPKRKCPPIPQTLREAVAAYLVARAIAETLREKVDAVYREILQEIPIFEDAHTRACSGERLLEVKDMYRSKDEDACNRIYAEGHKRLLALGIKPADMKPEFCPALVAESKEINCKWAVAEETAKFIGKPAKFAQDVFSAGEEEWEKFIELSVKIVLAEGK